MFWMFMLLAAGAATFSALGMYAVWFKVLTISLHTAAIIILGLSGVLIWRRLFTK